MSVETPVYLDIFFLFITGLTIYFFYIGNSRNKKVTLLLIGWSFLHAGLAFIGFYQNVTTMPPRFVLVILPVVVVLIYGLSAVGKRWAARHRRLEVSPFTHIVRAKVELVLFQLYGLGLVPEIMTFSGWNFDILFGLSAVIIGWLNYHKKISRKGMIAWNIIGLIMVIFIFSVGILSGDLPIQMLAFDQPNRAVQFFPYVLLPATIVPIVIYTHLTDLYLLLAKPNYPILHT